MSKETKETEDLGPVQLNNALLKVKSSLKAVIKGADNPFFGSKYADLNTHLEAVEPLLNANGLLLTQSTKTNGQFNIQETCITHAQTGATIVSALTLPELDNMQKLGGAISYARRYTLSALLGMRAEDDDGNLASNKAKKKVVKKSTATNDDF